MLEQKSAIGKNRSGNVYDVPSETWATPSVGEARSMTKIQEWVAKGRLLQASCQALPNAAKELEEGTRTPDKIAHKT